MFHRPLTLLQIVQLILFIVDSGCTKHMTGNLKLLCNFVEKFLEPVLHQWTSVHNSSELGIKTTAMNRQFKVVPNVVSSSCQTATSPTSVVMTSWYALNALMNSKRNVDKGYNERALHILSRNHPGQYICYQNQSDDCWSVINELTSGEIVSLNFIESIKEARSRVQDLTSGEIVSLNFIESIKEARSCVQDLTSGEIVSLNFIESIKEARSRVQDLTSGEIVSLNLLSRTRKLGHSTMELRSLIS
ncbi:hypothetical protein Tco_0138104 [Tanacetum coccineum]